MGYSQQIPGKDHPPLKLAARVRSAWAHPVFARWRQRLATDDHSLMAAGVAFFAFLAIAPMIAAIALAYGLIAAPETLAARLDQIRRAFPADTASVLEEPIRLALEKADGTQGLALLLALSLAIVGARGAATALIASLNRAYDRQESRSFVRLQLTALAVTAGLVVAIIVAFALVSASSLIGSSCWLPTSRWVEWIVDAVSTAIFMAMSAAVVASLYRWAPDCPSGRWRWISPGTVLTGVAWLGLSTAFSAYAVNIGRFGAAYGSLGAIVALLTWLYFSSLVLFAGASLNRAIEENQAAAAL
ncbi:MAG: YihY/virulence factor BrkB family protein [Rhizobium sp.]|nr:YihY/virulence factor BrkB family protein [Rhizobium sp.]